MTTITPSDPCGPPTLVTVTKRGPRSEKDNNCLYNFICNLNVAMLGLIQAQDCEEHKAPGPNIDNKIKSLSPKGSQPRQDRAIVLYLAWWLWPSPLPTLRCHISIAEPGWKVEYKKLWTLSCLTQHGIITRLGPSAPSDKYSPQCSPA